VPVYAFSQCRLEEIPERGVEVGQNGEFQPSVLADISQEE